MQLPTIEMYNKPEYYRQKLPAELANNRSWQLVYGEFRAPMYMAVLRHKIATFKWGEEFSIEAAKEVTQLLHVWYRMSVNRKAEWPMMGRIEQAFTDAMAAHIFQHHPGEINKAWVDASWINDDAVWDRLVIQPYHTL